ncbi:MAG: hypothetical protein ABI352_11565 [Candidatus Dormibacter sp.]
MNQIKVISSLAAVCWVAACGGTAATSSTSASPTASATTTATPPTAIPPSDPGGARQAVATLLTGTQRLGGTPCFTGQGSVASDFTGCSVTSRLAAQLPAGCGWQEFLYGNGSVAPGESTVTIGQAMASTSGTSVPILVTNGTGAALDATVIATNGAWLVDDLTKQLTGHRPLSIYGPSGPAC